MNELGTKGRLKEWAHWVDVCRQIGGPKGMRSWWGPIVTDPHVGAGRRPPGESTDPIDEARADRTDAAVKSLPRRPRRCILEQYLRGGTREQKARAYGCEKTAFYEHLTAAHALVEKIFESEEKSSKTHLRRRTRI